MGYRGYAAVIGALLTIPVGPLLLYTDMLPLIGTIWIGVTFTITAVSFRGLHISFFSCFKVFSHTHTSDLHSALQMYSIGEEN